MYKNWIENPEYSHAIFIPVISLYLIWQKKDVLKRLQIHGSWVGIAVMMVGLGCLVLGQLSTLFIITQYAFIVTLYGAILSLTSWQHVKVIWVPLLFLLFMIPLPEFLYNSLSSHLQLISSRLGVELIAFCGIRVYLEGNVIDMGNYQLQVVEACSGLRYLFPLISIAFLCAYIYRGSLFSKAIIILSSLPITVAMNSLRIAITGILVEYWSPSVADDFIHDFEGAAIFVLCFIALVVEMWILNKFENDMPFSSVFNIHRLYESSSGSHTPKKITIQGVVSLVIMSISIWGMQFIEEREEQSPLRMVFYNFPEVLDEWQGQKSQIEQIYLNALKLDDYLLMDYINSSDKSHVNLFVVYYASQRAGGSAHSPRSCLPGDGWRINDLTMQRIDSVNIGGNNLTVNRALIEKGEDKQLVYYWFQQRNRILTNEYLVKWFIFWDALTKNRTDGALIRLTTLVEKGEDPEVAELRLLDLVAKVADEIESYIPG